MRRQGGQCTAAKTADFAKKCRPVSRYVNIVIFIIIIGRYVNIVILTILIIVPVSRYVNIVILTIIILINMPELAIGRHT